MSANELYPPPEVVYERLHVEDVKLCGDSGVKFYYDIIYDHIMEKLMYERPATWCVGDFLLPDGVVPPNEAAMKAYYEALKQHAVKLRLHYDVSLSKNSEYGCQMRWGFKPEFLLTQEMEKTVIV